MSETKASLSEQHERRISRYLREVGDHLRELPRERREDALSSLNTQIELALLKSGNGVTDHTLDTVLENCGSPATQAAKLLKSGGEGSILGEWNHRVWLGVCAGIAQKLNVDANVVRLVAVLLGLIVPLLPVLLIAYVGVYLWSYMSSEQEYLDPVDPVKVAKAVGSALGVILALHIGTRLLFSFVSKLHQTVMAQPLVFDRKWGWLALDAGTWLFWALMIGVPLAALHSLPVPAAWSGTLKKTLHAGIALYAVWLCFGIASAITGIIVNGVQGFSGGSDFDAILSLFQQ